MRGGYHIRISVLKPIPTPSTSSSYKQSHLDTSTFIPTSLFHSLPPHPPKSTARRYTVHHARPQILGASEEKNESADYRFGPLRVDWVDFDNMDLDGAKKAAVRKEKESLKRGLYQTLMNLCTEVFGCDVIVNAAIPSRSHSFLS